MSRAYSLDLRERVVAAVEKGGLSARQAAQFGVGASTVIRWVERRRKTGSLRPSKIGGYKPRAICGRAPQLATATDQGEGLHLAWAGGRARRARIEGGLPLRLELRP
jgi:transposase